MIIEILDNYRYSGKVKPGKYEITSLEEGTSQQGRLFHKLLSLYFLSGNHSYSARNLSDFKVQIKNSLGLGGEKYWDYYNDDGNLLDEPKIKWRTISWKDYRKSERRDLISNVLSEMDQAGFLEDEYYMALRERLDERSRING